MQPDDWFSLVEDVAEKTLAVDSGRVGGVAVHHRGQAHRQIQADAGRAHERRQANRADIVVREIEVVPNGREQTVVFNGRLESAVEHDVNFPAAAIADASKIFVRLYPGPLSQVIEGMDAILRMPFGCFEQTSSATYPNVLALDYMKRTKKLTPEVHAKAEGFIANGYQRLLTFEVPGGGFSWFGKAPANKILTAYGLMEFSDMSKVHDVDPKLIERTQQWLAAQQQADGSWKPDTQFHQRRRHQPLQHRRAAHYRLPRLVAREYRLPGAGGGEGPAVRGAAHERRSWTPTRWRWWPISPPIMARTASSPARPCSSCWTPAPKRTSKPGGRRKRPASTARGASAAVETTGLAVQALLKWGEASATAAKALRLPRRRRKTPPGTWGTTQATIMALRALLLSTEKGAADVRGTVEISLNGKPVEKLTLTPENNDLLHQFVFKRRRRQGRQRQWSIRFDGKGGLAYQVVGRYFVPWTEKPAGEPLSIDVAYDRTHLAQDDIATATATVKNNLPKTANMVMVDLGIPPGFDLLSEDLQDYQEKSAGRKSGRLEKFSLTATQAILYFDSIAAGDTVTLNFRLRAKYPIRARTFQSRVYEYYDPEVSSVARPVQLEVAKR